MILPNTVQQDTHNAHCLWVLGEPKHIPELCSPGACRSPPLMRRRRWWPSATADSAPPGEADLVPMAASALAPGMKSWEPALVGTLWLRLDQRSVKDR